MGKPHTRGHPPPTVFVLWGAHFDEVAAVLVVIGLRRLGIRVKVVGISASCSKGTHGLGLQADWTLDEALAAADGAIGVVIPCTMLTFQGVWVDLRVQTLLEHEQHEKHRFILWVNGGE